MPATMGLLIIDDVAKELKVTPLEVRRLIARGRLEATPLDGDRREWRVANDDLVAYVKAGAADLHTMPKLRGMWFDSRDTRAAENFITRIRDAAQEQRLDDQAARNRAARNPTATMIQVQLLVTGQLAAAIGQATPVSPFAPATAKASEPRFASLSQAYLAHRARLYMKKTAIGEPNLKPLEELYANAQRYAELVAATVEAVLQERITVFQESRNVGTGRPRQVMFSYELNVRDFVSRQGLADVASLAF